MPTSWIPIFISFYTFSDGLTVGEVFKNFVSDIVKVHPSGGKIGLRPFVNSYKTPHL
jgi:hypothetical protein